MSMAGGKPWLPGLAWLVVLAWLGAAPAWALEAAEVAAWFPGPAELAAGAPSPAPVTVAGGPPLPAKLRFSLPLPGADWLRLGDVARPAGPGEGEGAGGVFTLRLAGFCAPDGPDQGRVEVFAHLLRREVNPAEWLVALLTRAGHVVLATRQTGSAAGPRFEALAALAPRAERGGPPVPLLVRAAVLRSGDTLWVVRCLARQPASPASRGFAAVTLGFRPEDAREDFLAGAWVRHCLPAGLCYLGPAATPRETAGAAAGEAEHLFTLGDPARPSGLLAVTAWRGSRRGESDLAGLLAGLGESLAARGYRAEFQGGALRCCAGRRPRGGLALPGRGLRPRRRAGVSALAAGGGRTGRLVGC